MNPTNTITTARFNKNLKGKLLRDTALGKKILKHALESTFGNLTKTLPNDVFVFEKEVLKADKSKKLTKTYLDSKKLKPIRTTNITYNAEGKKVSMTSTGTDINNPHKQTIISMHDLPMYGQRSYIYIEKEWTPAGNWEATKSKESSYKKMGDKIKATWTEKDLRTKANPVCESKTINYPKK